MKCPICKKDSAFLWSEDGIQEPARNFPVELKCGGKCAGNINGLFNKDPVHIADLYIDVIVKRSSIEINSEDIHV